MNHLTNEQISKIRRLLTDLTTHEHRESSYLRAYYLCAYKALHLSRGLYKSHLFMQNKANLLDAQMNVTSVLTKDYERNDIFAVPENKANSNPIKPNLPDAQMSVNSILTKDYERNDIFAVPENKANSNPIKPNLPNSQPKSTQKLKNPQYRAIKKPCSFPQGFNIKQQLSRPFDIPFDKLRVRSGQAAKMPDLSQPTYSNNWLRLNYPLERR